MKNQPFLPGACAAFKKLTAEDPRIGEWAFTLSLTCTYAEARRLIEERHGLRMNYDSDYCRWRQWWARKLQMDRFNELSKEAATEWVNGASDPSMRAYLIARIHALADIEENPRLAMDILRAEQKEEALSLERRRVEALEKVVASRLKKEAKEQSGIAPDRAERIQAILDG